MKLNRQGVSFFSVAVFFVVCIAHAGIFYCAAKFTPASVVPSQEKTVKLEVVSLNKTTPVEALASEQPSVGISEQQEKTEPHPHKTAKELTAPKQMPEKQMAAKSQEVIKSEQKPQVAQHQNIQTTQTDQPSNHTGFSSTSLAQGDGNKTVTKAGTEKIGGSFESTSPKKGNESNGGSGEGKTQRAALISINKIYPEEARRAGITGKVTVAVLVGINGRAKNVTVVSSSDTKLTSSGKRSAELGRYRPAIKNGEKQEESITVIIDYKI